MDSRSNCNNVEWSSKLANVVQRPRTEEDRPGEDVVVALSRDEVAGGDGSPCGWLTNHRQQSLPAVGQRFGNDVDGGPGNSPRTSSLGNAVGPSPCTRSDPFPRMVAADYHQPVVVSSNRQVAVSSDQETNRRQFAQPSQQMSHGLGTDDRVRWVKKVYGCQQKIATEEPPTTGGCHDSKAYLKRQAKQKEIAKTNRELMKRLVNAKPSVSTYRET